MERSASPEPSWSLDREIVLSRVYDAPRALVWKAWTDPKCLPEWFGPRGFQCKVHEIDIREGGRFRFDFIGPDGTLYDHRMVFLTMKEPELLVMDHGKDVDDDPGKFRVTITLDEQADKKTVLTLRQLHPTAAQRKAGIGFGAVELGYQTLDKLAEQLRRMA